jgi:Fe-S oxidoreductase
MAACIATAIASLLPAYYSEPVTFTLAEQLLLGICILASIGAFLWRMRTIVRNIFTARRDPDFHLRNLHHRCWRFFWEVLCQAKVIRQRPLPGLAHAFVFWGFLAFALVSANHIAAAFGLEFLSPTAGLGSFYFAFVAVFAGLVFISIAGLFIRRFILRPRWLGEHVSIESGFIALLIALLMVTYLAVYFFSADPTALRLLWWTHTLTLLLFLPVIPNTKHLHLLLSPFAVFFARDGFSQIPPLVGDEDFGLLAGKDLTQLAALQAYSCVECGRCTEHCPANNTGKELNPKEVILGLRSYMNDFGVHSDAPLLGKYNSQQAVFECTTCGACEFQCPVGVEHLPLIIGLRRGAVNTGAWQDSYGSKLFLSLERGGNALGISAAERDTFIEREQFPIFDGTQEYCLWLGCMGAYDPHGREIITAFARVMRHLGTTFGVMKKERCTGDPARRLGNDLVFQTLAEQNLVALAQAQVKKIVSICPHCVRTIAEDWKQYGVSPEIEHHSEFMARHADKLPAAHTEEKIVYHDPCYLGRYRNVYEQPRDVIRRAGELIEAPRSHERSFCCGAGGGLAFLGEETGERVSHNRAKELVATGAGTIGAACPFCNTMFRDVLIAITPANSTAPQLLDIAQIAAASLPATKQ